MGPDPGSAERWPQADWAGCSEGQKLGRWGYGLVGDGLAVGPDGLRGLFQTYGFYDSKMKPRSVCAGDGKLGSQECGPY